MSGVVVVLATGGRLLVSTPQPTAFFDALYHSLARHVGADAVGIVNAVFSLHDPAELAQLCRDVGFHDVIVRVVSNWSCRPRSASSGTEGVWLGATAPGVPASVYPEVAARKVPKDAWLMFELHYTPNGTATQ
jgi:hypothetical protein